MKFKSIMHERGFMDKLYYLNLKSVWIFTIACFILNVLSGFLEVVDLSIIAYGIPAAWTELGIHTGFIVWKAKTENCRKFKDNSKLEEIMEDSYNE